MPERNETLEAFDRIERKLDALIDHQKGLASHLAEMRRDLGELPDPIGPEVAAQRQAVRDMWVKRIERLNRVLTDLPKARLTPDPRFVTLSVEDE